tara:strand:- start:3916 stop:4524 length:609 start_codon:yes stop_codon:yes gene_type:complete
MDNKLIGNIVYRVERSTLTKLENPRLNNISFNDSCNISTKEKEKCPGTFMQKNVLPINQWRKTLNFSNCVPTNVIYKDNKAVNGHKRCLGGVCYRPIRKPNTEFISSYTTLNQRRKNINFNKHLNFNPGAKFSNPKFNTNGAVSSRNRIAALKNGNKNNNVYQKRCDNKQTEQYKRFKIVRKKCKPYHYGGKWKTALLTCKP